MRSKPIHDATKFGKQEVLNNTVSHLGLKLDLDPEERIKVKSFVLYVLNRTDDIGELMNVFPMIYTAYHGHVPAMFSEHPTYKFILRRFIML